jgi:hypothetical protein
MKLINALNLLNKNNMIVEKEEVNKNYNKYVVVYFNYTLTFSDNKSNDAENFYVVKNGIDNGFNGSNGQFFKTLTSAISFLKLQKNLASKLFDNSNAHLL